MRGLVGRLLDIDDMKYWHLHAEKIVVHPNYTHASENDSSRDVHGNGNNWDLMGPVGFPREWEWEWE